ncbi:mitochondrial import inner membrane translocase subunit TIM44 [Folsomia candida]|uniref:mitochondrial import inner membrane translocase subunit TIM44 n=1 Tax=Folsomia candida TaxID=158441 RepID=UPI000B8FC150|nr:mitochondrial import inner membrane translocase subunit TIM44 [Folsomia candida]
MLSKKLISAALVNANRVRYYSASSSGGKQPGFVSKFIDNIRQEFTKNKDMKDNISKFREEAKKLEESEALKQARRKFEIVESEASKGGDVFKEQLDVVKGKLQQQLKDASQSELAKKASQMGDSLGKQAQNVASSMADAGAKVAATQPFQAVAGAAAVVRDEIELGQIGDKIYKPPEKLRKRTQSSAVSNEDITPNTEAMGIELHKDSKFYQSWEKFKDSNPYVNKMLDWKIKFDESENPVIKASRLLTNKVSEVMGGLFQRTELSDTLTEIMTIDPTFDKEKFLLACERDIIPNILEAMCRGELDILEDWCYEAAFAAMSYPFKTARERGLKIESKILDISHVDLAMGRVLEQGPVLVITFTAQQVSCVRDATGKVVEGDPQKVLRVNHAWVLCRDRTEVHPGAAWRLLELSASASEQLM